MTDKSFQLQAISNRNHHFNAIGIFGTCLGLFGLLFGMFWDRLFDIIVQQNLVLRPNSMLYDIWKAPPVKTVLDFYLLNWTNPEDFQDPSIKPILQELGPYRFTEMTEKLNIMWHDTNSSVSYRKRSHYYFNAEGSRGSLSDRIITINSIAVTAAAQAKRFSAMRRGLTDLAMMAYPKDLTLRKTANEMLFGGFEDMLLNVGYMLPTSISDIVVPFDKYGYYYGRNGSAQFLGTFNMFTGADDITKLGQVNTWNFKNFTKSFPTQCSYVRGSAGEFGSPNTPENSTVNIFLPELCRDLPLEYDGREDMYGVTGYRFIGGPRSVDNGTLYEENACYCNGECAPSGVINVTKCWYDSPIFVSYPHFYNADPYYLNQVEGLNPQKQKHQFEYVIEPKTGIGMRVTGRTQVNQLVEPMAHSRMFRDVRKIFFPLFWLESKTSLTPDLVSFFKPLPVYVLCGQIFGGLCCLFGLILVFWHPIIQYTNKHLMQQLENANFEQPREHYKAKENIVSQEVENSEKNKVVESTAISIFS